MDLCEAGPPLDIEPLTSLEVSSGMVLGPLRPRRSLTGTAHNAPRRDNPPSVLSALESSIRPALHRPPCLVSFSGGTDSSVVLAVADRLARREGLPRPVPVSFHFTDAPQANEDAAQRDVIREVGTQDWQRVLVDDELDFLGPVARALLTRHGVLHPANAFLHQPLLDLARGGSLLTGVGGDQVLGGWQQVPSWRRPWFWPGRGSVGGRRAPDFAWLRPHAVRRVRLRLARELTHQPARFDRRVAWHLQRRNLRLGLTSLSRMAEATEVLCVSPLTDRGFVDALAAAGGRAGFGPAGLASRLALVSSVFEGLPPSVVARRQKARFGEVFWRGATGDFVKNWDGTGVDQALVDGDALARIWASDQPAGGTALLLQHCWLQGSRRYVEERTSP